MEIRFLELKEIYAILIVLLNRSIYRVPEFYQKLNKRSGGNKYESNP